MADSEEEIDYEDTELDPNQYTAEEVVRADEPPAVTLETQPTVVTAYPIPNNAGYPASLTVKSVIFVIVMFLWLFGLVFYYSYVHANLVFTQSSPPSAFNGLTVANVPFYSAAGVAAFRSELYRSFDYFVWMTDYLLILLPPYAVTVLLVAVLFRDRSAAMYGVYIIAIFFGILEFAKAVYWSFVWAGWFGLSCGNYQFCMSHNPADPVGMTSPQFVCAVIVAYISTVLSIGVIFVQWIVKSARLYEITINSKLQKLSLLNSNSRNQSDAAITIQLPRAQRRRAVPMTSRDGKPPPPLMKTSVQFF